MYSLCEMLTSVLRTAFNFCQKCQTSKGYVTSAGTWIWWVKMADFCSVVQAINDLVVRIERLEDSCKIGSIVLRLDYINRMLVVRS